MESDDDEDTEEIEGQQQVWGLESEMKLKSLTNKQAKRRYRKKLQKQAEEEAEQKAKLKKLAEEQEAAKLKAE